MNGPKSIVHSAKGVVFDLFHTLTTKESELGPMTREILGFTKEQWHKKIFETSHFRLCGQERDSFRVVERMAREIDPNISTEVINRAVEHRLQRFKRAVEQISPATLHVLDHLRDSGKKLGLISNADTTEIASWASSPLSTRFHMAIFSCDVGYVKPDHQIYGMCLDRIGLVAGDCVYVGDGGSSELRAARELGFRTVMVTGVIQELWPELIESRSVDADYVIETLSELV